MIPFLRGFDMLKSIRVCLPYVTVVATVLGSVGGVFSSPASARTLVVCGPHGAAQIVDIVPAGCRVLSAASPPMQAGNAVEKSRLNFYFTASTPSRAQTQSAIALHPESASVKPIQ
jgi:hypothetical protein